MTRTTRTVTFSLPPEMAERVMKDGGRTMSELVREALRLYMDERELRRLERHEMLKARQTDTKESRRKA